MGLSAGRQPFDFHFISLCLACAGILEDLLALCQVPGTCRPVMEHSRLYISLGDRPSSFLIFHLFLSIIHQMQGVE